MRSFTTEVDPQSGTLVKELRGWRVRIQEVKQKGKSSAQQESEAQTNSTGQQLDIRRLRSDDSVFASITNPLTGLRLAAEKDVRFC